MLSYTIQAGKRKLAECGLFRTEFRWKVTDMLSRRSQNRNLKLLGKWLSENEHPLRCLKNEIFSVEYP